MYHISNYGNVSSFLFKIIKTKYLIYIKIPRKFLNLVSLMDTILLENSKSKNLGKL